MNKKGNANIKNIGIGSMTGVIGLILMSFGQASGNIVMVRVGIALTTFGGWIITWN